MDLRVLSAKDDLSEDEKICWRYTQFLIKRIVVGDRVVCQFGQPLREFWVGEVVAPGYKNSNSDLAYLFILGERSDEFLHEVDRAAETLSKECGKKISLVVVDENRIADLYLRHILGAHQQLETEI